MVRKIYNSNDDRNGTFGSVIKAQKGRLFIVSVGNYTSRGIVYYE